MNIEAKEFELKMTHGELWQIAFDLRSNIQNTIKTHWVNHQSNWPHNEKERLNIIRSMFFALGRPGLYEDIMPFAEQTFKEFNSK